jgi:hypothetical protein
MKEEGIERPRRYAMVRFINLKMLRRVGIITSESAGHATFTSANFKRERCLLGCYAVWLVRTRRLGGT